MKNNWLLTAALVNCSLFSSFLFSAHGQVSVLTQHNDVSRTGLNPNETLLTPANVNSNQFGQLFVQNVDGFVVAQPLYYANLSINGGTHNVVYVATQNDTVYAFDADSSQPALWNERLLNPPSGGTAVPVPIVDTGCGNETQFTQIGIMGTPVIDPSTNTLYVVAKNLETQPGVKTPWEEFYLHALDITTGDEKFGGPSVITGSFSGITNDVVTFQPNYQFQRPGLLLSNGVVYVAFGSNGCDLNAHGWVMAYSASNVQTQVGVFCTTPDSTASTQEGSIWQGGAGLVADSGGNVYAMTANGVFDNYPAGSGLDYGDTFLKLDLGSSLPMNVVDYFTPYNQEYMAANDLDLGSGGPLLLPSPQPGTFPNLLIGAGKLGTIYLVDQDDMGKYNPGGDQIVQESLSNVLEGALFGVPTYWNSATLGQMVYFAPDNTPLKAFSLSLSAITGTAQLSSTPVLQTQKLGGVATPIVSANGTSNGIVWMVRVPSPSLALLSAWNASTLGSEIYDSSQAGSRDTLSPVAHFVTPTVANGKGYVGTQTQLAVYGLLPALSASAGNNQSATVGTSLPVALQVLASNPYPYTPTLYPGVSVSFSDGDKGGIFNPSAATTNDSGIATSTYTLPTVAGAIAITASCASSGCVGCPNSSCASTQFSVTANPGLPAGLTCGGSDQTATAGSALPAPVSCAVKDSYGNPVPGVAVNFADNGAGGAFSANPVTTNSSGKVSVTYTTSTKAGSVKITVSVTGVTPLTVFEKVAAGSPAALNIVSGNNQMASAGTMLPKPLVVGVFDQYSNPVSGATVNFADGGAGGTLSAPSVTTNLKGQASVSYTLPGNPGPVSVTASVSGVNPAVFSETAN
jgi:hypothetical protein